MNPLCSQPDFTIKGMFCLNFTFAIKCSDSIWDYTMLDCFHKALLDLHSYWVLLSIIKKQKAEKSKAI